MAQQTVRVLVKRPGRGFPVFNRELPTKTPVEVVELDSVQLQQTGAVAPKQFPSTATRSMGTGARHFGGGQGMATRQRRPLMRGY